MARTVQLKSNILKFTAKKCFDIVQDLLEDDGKDENALLESLDKKCYGAEHEVYLEVEGKGTYKATLTFDFIKMVKNNDGVLEEIR